MTTMDELARAAKSLDGLAPDHSDLAALPPDFARIEKLLGWGGVWHGPGLDLKLRSLAAVSAQCVINWEEGLKAQLRLALNLGITPQKLKGVYIQLLFYAGIPATVFGLIQAQRVIAERKEWQELDVPLQADWLDTLEAKLERGSAICSQLWGDAANMQVANSLAQQMVPEAADIVDGYNFGEIWARADLEPKERMVCVLAALLARRHLGHLRNYIGYAVKMGLSQREICETLAQAGWQRGWPLAEEGLAQAKAVFAEMGV